MAQFSRMSEWSIKKPESEPEIARTTRISVRLEALRNKQHEVMKELKFMKNARRKFMFSDVELKTDLKGRRPEKELLLQLFTENKQFKEKCFFADVATHKCQAMTGFYSDIDDKLSFMMNRASYQNSNLEEEQLLQTFHDETAVRLEEARQKFLNQRKDVDEKNKIVSELGLEMNKAKMEMSEALSLLKAKLAKGDILTDQEILQLSLGTCLDSNTRLAAAIQSHGQQSDELREKFIWKRDHFVSQLAKDHTKTLTKVFAPKMEMAVVAERSDPPTPKGSMFDIIMQEKNEMVSALARIGRNTEDTTKFHYKLLDLKQRLQETYKSKPGVDADFDTDNSTVTMVSNPQMVSNPS